MSATLDAKRAEAVDRLKRDALGGYSALQQIARTAAAAVTELRKATDHTQALDFANQASVAISDLAGVAKRIHEEADAALARAMLATETSLVCSTHHMAELKQNFDVDISDRDAVPDEYWTRPAAYPNKAKIKKAAEDGVEMNWCTVVSSGVSVSRKAKR